MTYRFLDSSVPPPYHRSYTISVTSAMVQLTVDSYGEVLLDETYPLTIERFNDFIAQLKKCKLKNQKEKKNDACVGGTTDSFSVWFANAKTKIDGNIYHCGGKDYGTLAGNGATAKKLFQELIPDLAAKIESTRK